MVDENILNSLKQKHPQSQTAYEETLINGERPVIHLIIFDDINEELARKAAIRTKGESGPSGLDADGWRKMLTSKVFGSCTSDRLLLISLNTFASTKLSFRTIQHHLKHLLLVD